MAHTWKRGQSNVIDAARLRDNVSGAYLSGATMDFTLYKSDKVTLAAPGLSAVPMAYVAATNATFRAVVAWDPAWDALLLANKLYRVKFIAHTVYGDQPFWGDVYMRDPVC